MTGEPILLAQTANQYLARYWFAVRAGEIGSPVIRFIKKSSPPRGWDGCTFGADLRVCSLWVRSRSLPANHEGGPGYILLPA
jgi:sugar lactone lactonase YvrE